MNAIPARLPAIGAGEYPAQLLAACAVLGEEPASLLAWSVRVNDVQLILQDGRKVVFTVSGKWERYLSSPAPGELPGDLTPLAPLPEAGRGEHKPRRKR